MSEFFFIPARGGSKRFPKKNIALFEGRPLICHVIEKVFFAKPKAPIFISTDSQEIAEVVNTCAKRLSIETLVVDSRPQNLGSDSSSVGEVLQEFIRREKPSQENCFCIYPTAVLIRESTILDSLTRFENNQNFNSLMGASEFNLHPWQALYQSTGGDFRPFFPDYYNKKSQELPMMYASNGSFYLVRTKAFERNPNFYAAPLDLYKMSTNEAVDINYPEDLAKVMMIKRWQTNV